MNGLGPDSRAQFLSDASIEAGRLADARSFKSYCDHQDALKFCRIPYVPKYKWVPVDRVGSSFNVASVQAYLIDGERVCLGSPLWASGNVTHYGSRITRPLRANG